jgi:hypothetical protein
MSPHVLMTVTGEKGQDMKTNGWLESFVEGGAGIVRISKKVDWASARQAGLAQPGFEGRKANPLCRFVHQIG